MTAGGRSEAEMATPMSDPELSPKRPRAMPAPDGRAMRIPTQRERNIPLKRTEKPEEAKEAPT